MGLPILILTAIMGVITAPGLIAQHLEARRARKSGEAEAEGTANA